MKRLVIGVALFCSACSGGSPTAPTPPAPTPTPTPTPPPVVSNIAVSPCPTIIVGFPVDMGFYQQIGCNAFDGPMQSVRKWNVAPKLYIRTVDEAGAPINAVTLDTVQNAMVSVAALLTGGKFGLASVERGMETRENVTGYVTVKWSAVPESFCGNSDVARDGGAITFSPKTLGCSCNGSAIRPRTARHELGHALGYWHTSDANDLMSNPTVKPCEQLISARETQAMAYQYR